MSARPPALHAPPGQRAMEVELAWVDEDGTVVSQTLELPEGATLGEALAGIGAPRLREGLTAGRLVAAVFGELRRPGEVLSAGDRIELLEGLVADPKIARQRRVAVRRAQEARRTQQVQSAKEVRSEQQAGPGQQARSEQEARSAQEAQERTPGSPRR